jgi:hypothetical protein
MVIDVSRMGDKNLGIQIAWDQKYEVDKKKKKTRSHAPNVIMLH